MVEKSQGGQTISRGMVEKLVAYGRKFSHIGRKTSRGLVYKLAAEVEN